MAIRRVVALAATIAFIAPFPVSAQTGLLPAAAGVAESADRHQVRPLSKVENQLCDLGARGHQAQGVSLEGNDRQCRQKGKYRGSHCPKLTQARPGNNPQCTLYFMYLG